MEKMDRVGKPLGSLGRLLGLALYFYRQRHMIGILVREDLKSRYLGSFLGVFWAFVHPTVTVAVLWFVTQVGFKSQPVNGVVFIFWLLGAMVPWFFLADCLGNGVNAILEKPFLVKKMAFPTHLLPITKVLSASILHGFIVGVTLIASSIWGPGPKLQMFQVLYYYIAACCLMVAVSWITASLVPFYRDLSQIIGIVLQVGFWVTPIFWSLDMIPKGIRPFFKLNPLYYITDGYRESLVGQVWLWEKPFQALYFWVLTLSLAWIGGTLFRRLRPHFPDVL